MPTRRIATGPATGAASSVTAGSVVRGTATTSGTGSPGSAEPTNLLPTTSNVDNIVQMDRVK